MEIVHIVRQYAPSVGGLEDAVSNLCRTLAAMPGVRVRVVTLDSVFADPQTKLPKTATIDGIEVTRIPWSGSRRYPFAPSVLGAVGGADIVHVHAIDFFYDFMAFTKPLHRRTLVASTHGGFFHTDFASRLKKIFFQTVTRTSSLFYARICASSENDAATFRRIAGDRVIAIENGVNIDKWHDCGSKAPLRSLVFIGRWSGNKRVPALIELVGALRRLDPSWTLHIVGLAADETVDTLRAAAAGVDAGDAVHIHVSPPQEEIGRILSQCSYIASASAYEGFGLSIVEGLSAGLLPLLSEIPPFDKLRHGLGFGEIVDPADSVASAQRIEAFHKRVETDYAAMRQTAMAFSQRYAWKGVAAAFMDVYEKALGR